MEHETFGERLLRLRLAVGLSAHELSRRIGATHSVIKRAELGEQMIRAARLPALCRALGCSIDYLLTGRERPHVAALHAAIRQRAPYERLLAIVDNHDA